jgi:hypothetical protein
MFHAFFSRAFVKVIVMQMHISQQTRARLSAVTALALGAAIIVPTAAHASSGGSNSSPFGSKNKSLTKVTHAKNKNPHSGFGAENAWEGLLSVSGPEGAILDLYIKQGFKAGALNDVLQTVLTTKKSSVFAATPEHDLQNEDMITMSNYKLSWKSSGISMLKYAKEENLKVFDNLTFKDGKYSLRLPDGETVTGQRLESLVPQLDGLLGPRKFLFKEVPAEFEAWALT